jgi:hypothetical protein
VRGAQKQLCTKQRHETLAGKICRTPISDKQCTYHQYDFFLDDLTDYGQ